MYPLVLLKSYGQEKCADIIKDILESNSERNVEPMSIWFDSYHLKTHKLSISTKYYKTDVLLFECGNINTIPATIKSKIEGSIFYFDSNDKNFLSEIDALVTFVKDNNIGVSSLVTRNLSETTSDGLSYDVIKSRCKLDINVIDLNERIDNEEPEGYAEVLEILKNHIWSTVQISTHNSNTMCKSEEIDINVEEALNEFEELLNKFQQFKDVSRTLCREEVLKNAENLAELFANMLKDD